MFTDRDTDEFVHIQKVDDAFLIVQKNLLLEEDRNDFHIVKEDFEYSREYTALKTAREACFLLLDLLGVKVYDKASGLRLAIEVVKDSPKEPIN